MKFPVSAICLMATFIISCGKSVNYIEDKSYQIDDKNASRGQNERVSSLIFHYTALPFEESLRVLTAGAVSAHWLVPENGNKIYKLVDENKRAFHAGISTWKSRTNINDTSVGVEIVNLGFVCSDGKTDCSKEKRKWFPYPEEQQTLIVELAKDIQKRFQIDPLCVVAHSDLAVGRKSDPGPLFPWKLLAENGVGSWVTEDEIIKEIQNINTNISSDISRLLVQTRLYEFGYEIKNLNVSDNFVLDKMKKYGYDSKKIKLSDLSALNELNNYGNLHTSNDDIFDSNLTTQAIDAFLMHYLPEEYLSNTIPENKKILATLQALLIKYPNRAKIGCGF
ncbi:N-acetylmuramoyl-L-alanine amidase [Fluviispira vulneris]|uniref:N-acetylmuramoyl-L-alanine amidase n=1 Tax=Fluviispira vulneris TaxID=2763012 RepID=UPI00164550C9|nr:N-acetylmuramoyl-L-alanine amidase [Fluviispira vulneris]